MISPLFWPFSIFNLQDLIEIGLIASSFFYISLWFSKDKEKPLLQWLYSYTTLFLVADYTHMATLATGLVIFAPVTFIALFLIHKETLQKNFISLQSIKHPNTTSSFWPDIVVQMTLMNANSNKEVLCLVEKNDSVLCCIEPNETIQATISKEILLFITSNPLFRPEKLLIMSNNGILLGINKTWKKNSLEAWFTSEVQEQAQWIQEGIFFTTKTDALLFKYNNGTRNYTIINGGKIQQNVSSQHVIRELYRHQNINPISNKEQGGLYGTSTSNTQDTKQTMP